MRRASVWTALGTLVAAFFTLSPPAEATNGMYLVGYGAEVMGRAGANLGISDRSLALNFNPAGISQLQGRHFSVNLAVLAPSLETSKMMNLRTDGEDNFFPLPTFAYVRGANDSPWT